MIDFEELPIEFDCDITINKVIPSMIETKQENNWLHLQKGSLKEIDRLQFQKELMSTNNSRRNSRPWVSNHKRLLNSSSSNLLAYASSTKENNSLISVRKGSIWVEKLTKLPNIRDLNGNNNCTKTDTWKFQVENKYDEKFLVPNNLNQTKIQSENKQQGKSKRRRHSKKRSTSKPRSKSKRLYPSIWMYQSQKINYLSFIENWCLIILYLKINLKIWCFVIEFWSK